MMETREEKIPMQVLMTIPADPEAPFDNSVAANEGWGVIDAGPAPDGGPLLQLQSIAGPSASSAAFGGDDDAWKHVVARAREGSALHRAALAAVNDIERTLIEATCGAW